MKRAYVFFTVFVLAFALNVAVHAQTSDSQATLASVHKLYIEPMGGVDSKGKPMNLHEYLKGEIEKQLGKRVAIVATKEEADAVLSGTGSWANTAGAAVTGRLMALHDTATGAVSVEKNGIVLWSSEAGDRNLFWGPLARGGPAKVASRLTSKFKSALESADKAARSPHK